MGNTMGSVSAIQQHFQKVKEKQKKYVCVCVCVEVFVEVVGCMVFPHIHFFSF